MIQAIIFLALVILGCSVVMIRALQAMKRVHATALWLQMEQQLSEPKMVHALHTVQSLDQTASMNEHGQTAPPMLMNGQLEAVQTVNRYFANVGTLVRDHVLDEGQVLALMGPSLSNAWYASRAYRELLKEKSQISHDNFDWLYTEWLNDEYQRHPWHNAA